jgi:hypothetical protein
MKFFNTVFVAGAVVLSATAHSEGDTGKRGTDTGKNDNGPIRLESIFVGDKEQPAISYFIPWQGVGTPDELHWNLEEKNDQALEPVDREIMLRSMQLYEGMNLENSPR